MAKQVDNRVVQMQFDNKKFEQGVQTTLKSISNLDQSLNALNKITLGGFEKLGSVFDKIDFGMIGTAADAVASRMSAMGVVGATVLQNLTNAAINTAKQLGSITFGQIMSGGKNRALNLEQAKFQLQGLGVAWEDIEEDIDYGVKDTAYGLDAAAKAASQLVASQVQLGDEMKMSLRGISGVAAMTSSSFEDISNIFTTVAGNGRLYAMQLQQFSSRGLNAAATLAQSLGVTEAEVREMVSKGKIDFKTFAKAMDDAFGPHAKEANKTFTGALSNMKAALSRIGAEFYSPGLEYARDIFISITGAVNQLKKSMAEYRIFEYASDIMGKLTETTTAFFNSISDKGGMNRFGGGALKTVQAVLAQISTFLNRGFHTQALEILGTAVKNVWKIIRAVFAGVKMAFPYDITFAVENFLSKLSSMITEFDKQAVIYEDIRNTIAGLLSVLKIVYTTVKAIWDVIGKPIFDTLITKMKELLSWTSDVGKKIKDFADKYHPFTDLYNNFREVSAKWNLGMMDIHNHFLQTFGKTVPEILDGFKKKLVGAFKSNDISKEARKIAEKGNNPYAILANEMGKSEAEIHKMIKNGEIDFNEFADIMNKTLGEGTVKSKLTGMEIISKGIDLLVIAINKLIDVAKFFYNIFSGMKPLFDYVGEGVDLLKEKISSLTGSMKGVGSDFGESLVSNMSPGLREFLTDVKEVFDNFKKIIGDAFAAVQPAVKGIMNVLKTISLDDIVKGLAAGGGIVILDEVIRRIRYFVMNLTAIFKPLKSSVGDLKEVWTKSISGFVTSMTQKNQAERLKSLAISVGILAASMLILSSIDTDKLGKSMAAVTALIGELMGSFYLLDKKASADALSKNSLFSTARLGAFTAALIALSVGLLIMASALKKVSKIDPERLATSFWTLSAMLAELAGSIYLLSMVKGDVPKIGATILGMSAALYIMASALGKLAKFDADQLAGAILAMTILMVELGGALFLLSTFSDGAKLTGIAAAFLVFAIALNALIIPLTVMALLNGKIGTAITELTALLIVLGLFAGIMSMVSGGGAALAGIGAGLIVMAAGLTLLMVPLTTMALLEGKIGTAITELTVLLIILGLFAGIMTMVSGGGLGLAGIGAGLIIFAAGLSLLMVPLSALAMMDSGKLKQAIGAFATILVLLGIMVGFAAALSGFTLAILGVAAGLFLIGASVALVGAGIAGLGAGIYLVASGFYVFVDAMKLAGNGIVDLAVKAAYGILAFLVTLGNAKIQMAESFANLVEALCDGILKSLVKICDTIGLLIIGILDSLTDKAPNIILDLLELVFAILDGLLKGLTDKVPVLARDLYNFCMEVLDELVKLMKQTPMDLIDIFFGGGFDKDKNSGKKLGEWFKGIFHKEKDSKEVQQAGKDTAEAVTDATSEELESKESQDKVNSSMGSLMSGMSDYISSDSTVPDAMAGLSEKSLEGLESPLDIKGGKSMATYDIAGFANEGFLSGAEEGIDQFFAMGESGGESYIKGLQKGSGVASPSWKAMEVAKYIDEGMAIGLEKNTASEDAIAKKGNSLIDILGGSMSNTSITPLTSMLSAFSAAMSSDADYEPTISPVMDLSNLNNGFNQIDSMFSSRRSLALAGDASFIQNEGKRLSFELQNDNSSSFMNGFSSLGGKLDRLGEAIMNRQIVLDSGELVGGLVNPMDRSLGVRAIRAQRGGAR